MLVLKNFLGLGLSIILETTKGLFGYVSRDKELIEELKVRSSQK